jgi:hypothetical protein
MELVSDADEKQRDVDIEFEIRYSTVWLPRRIPARDAAFFV